eukprot:878518-Prorocentrum_minimum.AAC.4
MGFVYYVPQKQLAAAGEQGAIETAMLTSKAAVLDRSSSMDAFTCSLEARSSVTSRALRGSPPQ